MLYGRVHHRGFQVRAGQPSCYGSVTVWLQHEVKALTSSSQNEHPVNQWTTWTTNFRAWILRQQDALGQGFREENLWPGAARHCATTLHSAEPVVSNIENNNLQSRYVLHLGLGRHVGAEGETRALSTAHPLHVTTWLSTCLSNVAPLILSFDDLFGSSTARKVRPLFSYLGKQVCLQTLKATCCHCGPEHIGPRQKITKPNTNAIRKTWKLERNAVFWSENLILALTWTMPRDSRVSKCPRQMISVGLSLPVCFFIFWTLWDWVCRKNLPARAWGRIEFLHVFSQYHAITYSWTMLNSSWIFRQPFMKLPSTSQPWCVMMYSFGFWGRKCFSAKLSPQDARQTRFPYARRYWHVIRTSIYL